MLYTIEENQAYTATSTLRHGVGHMIESVSIRVTTMQLLLNIYM